MTKLAELMGDNHPLFVQNIFKMEQASGNSGTDIVITIDVQQQAHDVMRAIGLDPADTTARELYSALNARVARGGIERLLSKCNYVLLRLDDQLVSFNAQDVIENAHHKLPFHDRKVDHAQRHLRMEIIRRYARHERTHTPTVHSLAEEAGLKRAGDEDHRDVPKHARKQDAPSMLAVGDIFTDAFIQLDENYARIDEDENGDKRLSLPFGSKPPYVKMDPVMAVGPSPNAGVSCARLGMEVQLLAWIGDDVTGQEMIEYLHTEDINTDTMITKPETKSNYYYVLRYGADRTILVKNEEYDYEWVAPKETPDWLYLSLIAKKSWQLHEDVLDYLEDNPDIKFAFQPGTFHFEWGAKKLERVYKRSHIVIMNREEAVDVTGESYDSIKGLADALHALGPKVVVITDGPNGSYASYDGKLVTVPNYPDPAKPLDRTGAGDAFASTIVAALALGKQMDEALLWAPINSMNVVQNLGAQAGLLTQAKIQEYLKSAPEWYKVKDLE